MCVFKSSFLIKLGVGYQLTDQAPFPSQSCWVTLLGNSSFWECNPFPDKRERIAIRTIQMLSTLIGTELLGRSHKVSLSGVSGCYHHHLPHYFSNPRVMPTGFEECHFCTISSLHLSLLIQNSCAQCFKRSIFKPLVFGVRKVY